MENAQSEKKVELWFKEHLYLLAIIFALLSILVLCAPIYTAKPLATGERTNIYFWNIFSGEFRLGYGVLSAVILMIVGSVLSLFHKKSPYFLSGAMLCFLVGALLFLVGKDIFNFTNSELYGYNSATDDYDLLIWSGTIKSYSAKLGAGSVIATIFAAIAALCAFDGSYEKDTFSVRDMVESAVLIAMAVGLNFIKLFPAPTGGSVNLQMLPLMIIAFRHGPTKGFLCGGIVYGLITCLTDGYGFEFFPFDYLVGFGSVAICGFFKNKVFPAGQKGYAVKGEIYLFIAAALSTFVRFIGGSVSSMVYYNYTFIAAITYNAAYVFISGGIAIAVIMALYGPLCRINSMFPVKEPLKEKAE